MPEFLSPTKVLDQLELRSDMNGADFGCGSGGWVIPLAKRLEEGKVFAIDVLEEPLSALKSKAQSEGIFNIETIRADVEKNSTLKDNSVDIVLMTNLLFEVEDRAAVLKEGKRVLKPGGEILVVDWEKSTKLGPPKKVSSDEVKREAEKLGFKLKKELDTGGYHYGLLLTLEK